MGLYNQNYYACSSYIVNGQNMQHIVNYLWSKISNLTNYNNISQGVVRILVFPFCPDISGLTKGVIQLGNEEIESAQGYPIKNAIPNPTILRFHCQDGDSSSFLNFEPFIYYDIFLPFYGYARVEAKYIHTGVDVTYTCNFSTGDCLIEIRCLNYLIFNASVNIAFSCPITGNNSAYIEAQKESMRKTSAEMNLTGITDFLKIAGGIALIAAGAPAGGVNPMTITGGSMVVGGMASIINTTVQSNSLKYQADALKYDITNVGYQSNSSFGSDRTPRLRITRCITYYPENYSKLYGKPLVNFRKLSNIKGYTEVESIHLNIPCLSNELTEIELLLHNGVILNTITPTPEPSPEPTPTPEPQEPSQPEPSQPEPTPEIPEGEEAEMLCCFNGKFRVTGMRGTPAQTGRSRNHYGLDMVGVDSINVYSIVSGWVKITDTKDGLGKCVWVQMDTQPYYGQYILYGHLSKFEVSNGQYVNQGQLIGVMGNTGESRGAHTHLEWRGVSGKWDSDFSKYNICEFTGIPNISTPGQNTHIGSPLYKFSNSQSVKEKLNIEQQTLQYLEQYKYGESLINKIDENIK